MHNCATKIDLRENPRGTPKEQKASHNTGGSSYSPSFRWERRMLLISEGTQIFYFGEKQCNNPMLGGHNSGGYWSRVVSGQWK